MKNFERPTLSHAESTEGAVEIITTRERFISLARELAESQESFSFPGITAEAYARFKQDEEEIPGYTDFATPIDALIGKFQKEGMRVIVGADNHNVFLVPAHCPDTDIDANTIKVRTLTDTAEDPRMSALITAEKNWDSLS